MSSNTWTSTAVASEARQFSEHAWRAVEAQHRVATMSLVDSLAEQAQLEALLDASKPPIPAAALGLHWLLFTPFRYPTSRHGSRFRRPYDPGVFYAAYERSTACAELGYWRWRFLAESPALGSIDTCRRRSSRSKCGASRSMCVALRFPMTKPIFRTKPTIAIVRHLRPSRVKLTSMQSCTGLYGIRSPAVA